MGAAAVQPLASESPAQAQTSGPHGHRPQGPSFSSKRVASLLQGARPVPCVLTVPETPGPQLLPARWSGVGALWSGLSGPSSPAGHSSNLGHRRPLARRKLPLCTYVGCFNSRNPLLIPHSTTVPPSQVRCQNQGCCWTRGPSSSIPAVPSRLPWADSC